MTTSETGPRAREILAGTAQGYGLTVDIDVIGGVNTAPNDQAAIDLVGAAARLAGAEVVAASKGFSDDATEFMRRVQHNGGIATYVGIGADMPSGHHTRTFDIDETALPIGVTVLENLVRQQIEKGRA
jgi:aminobenzoyl-glutamate utilization protein A